MIGRRLRILLTIGTCCVSVASAARADLVKLHGGGEIRGVVEGKPGADESGPVVVRTLTGGTVIVPRDQVRFVTWRKPVVEEYETRARTLADSLDDHWRMAEWCRENGLTVQRELHLFRVVEFEPDHAAARAALHHVQHEGEWMTRDEMMRAQGYVKHKNRYVTPQELDLIEKTASQLKAEQEWFKNVRLWQTWLTGRSPQRRDVALAEFKKIEDPAAVPALERFLRDDQQIESRTMFVEILGRIPGDRPVASLVQLSLHDDDYELRYKALNSITEAGFAAARPVYVRELRNSSNDVVRRAANALGRMGDPTVVPDLIEALVTSHRYRVRVATQNTVSVNSDGSFGPGAGTVALPPEVELLLRTGQLPFGVQVHNAGPRPPVNTRVVVVNHQHQNSEVQTALHKLTGENFGYDERTWRLWWSAKKNGPKAG